MKIFCLAKIRRETTAKFYNNKMSIGGDASHVWSRYGAGMERVWTRYGANLNLDCKKNEDN